MNIFSVFIRKYAPEEGYSIFMCGPGGMYAFLDQEIWKLNLERKWIRHELQGEVHNPQSLKDYPKERTIPETVNITVKIRDDVQTVPVKTSETILQSLEKHGIAAPSHCRSGECSWCHSQLISGDVYCPQHLKHRRDADSDFTISIPAAHFRFPIWKSKCLLQTDLSYPGSRHLPGSFFEACAVQNFVESFHLSFALKSQRCRCRNTASSQEKKEKAGVAGFFE